MSTALATHTVSLAIEKALIHGDLSSLDPQGRIEFYNATCKSLGLNPLTKPFAYITLNGKLQLYALKDCTEQLRKIHGVSITSVTPQQIGELIVVVATARDADGKVDSSTGAVSIGSLKGEALANAMMKAETKAKRRVTLSICGLGILDETEVNTLREQGLAKDESGKSTEQIAAEAKWNQLDPPQSLKGQLQGSIASLPSPQAEESQEQPPDAPGEPFFGISENVLSCRVLEAMAGIGSNKREYLKLTVNGRIDGWNFVWCFDTKLFNDLKGSVSHDVQFRVKVDSKGIKIEEILSIEDMPYISIRSDPPPATHPQLLEIFPLLGWGPNICEKWLAANSGLSDDEKIGKLEAELDK